MITQTFGATPWLILMVAACSSSTTTQNVVNSDAGASAGGSSSTAGKSSTGGTEPVGASTTTHSGGAVAAGGSTSSIGATGGATQSAGGATGTGGTSATATGGQVNVGGTTSAGGTKAVGGASSIGGTAAAGGSQGTGGATGNCVTGTLGCPCYTSGLCAANLTCINSICQSAAVGGASGIGGGLATGGRSAAGGAATGGRATGGAAAGGAATGGAATGGAATGGRATGGAPTGGAPTGGAPTGGAPTGGAPAINQFVSGPCVTSPNLSDIEIFASSGQRIYRRVVSSSSSGSWQSLANLDATTLDIRSDLDCSSNVNTVHIAASGPNGSYMHATGFGTAYNPFTRELSPSTFGYIGVSIAAWSNSTNVTYQMAAVPASGKPTWATFDGSTTGGYTPTVDYSLMSAPDIAYQRGNGDNPNRAQMVAFTGNGMVYFDSYSGYGSGWEANTYWPPPASTTYSYSPTLCNHSDDATGDYRRHVAVVAGGTLYYAYSELDWTNGATFSAWQMAGTVAPASSPDCVVTSDNTVHIVVLTTTGTVAHVYRTGVSGSWRLQDLGAF
jgi:hypothetical protein